ncbi:MAG: hypothetical protein OXT67_00890 [Zetaproteobacteria bacterium]|nr:hypothetical protein [Zetaproteobacteria bacterium]
MHTTLDPKPSFLLVAVRDPDRQIRIWRACPTAPPTIPWPHLSSAAIKANFRQNKLLVQLPHGNWHFYSQTCTHTKLATTLKLALLDLETPMAEATIAADQLITMPELLKLPEIMEARALYLQAFQLLMGSHLDSLEAYEVKF